MLQRWLEHARRPASRFLRNRALTASFLSPPEVQARGNLARQSRQPRFYSQATSDEFAWLHHDRDAFEAQLGRENANTRRFLLDTHGSISIFRDEINQALQGTAPTSDATRAQQQSNGGDEAFLEETLDGWRYESVVPQGCSQPLYLRHREADQHGTAGAGSTQASLPLGLAHPGYCVLLDVNRLEEEFGACYRLATLRVCKSNRWLVYTVDLFGDDHYRLFVKRLGLATVLPESNLSNDCPNGTTPAVERVSLDDQLEDDIGLELHCGGSVKNFTLVHQYLASADATGPDIPPTILYTCAPYANVDKLNGETLDHTRATEFRAAVPGLATYDNWQAQDQRALQSVFSHEVLHLEQAPDATLDVSLTKDGSFHVLSSVSPNATELFILHDELARTERTAEGLTEPARPDLHAVEVWFEVAGATKEGPKMFC
eukprot:scaffold1522_cov340-Prasinococcus_capsulatus_cf.AAC.2